MTLERAARRRSRSILASAVLAALCLGGCAVGPDYHRPKADAPKQFAVQAGAHSGKGAQDDPAAIANWWHNLHDPELDSLVVRALKDNPSLEIALAHLQQARTYEVAVTGLALPSVNLGAGGGRGTGTNLDRGGLAPGALHAADNRRLSGTGIDRIDYVAGGMAQWNLDLFGRYRRMIEAARYQSRAQMASRDAVQVAVVAEVVRAYVDLRGLQTQLLVLRQNELAASDLWHLMQARYSRGITNELDATLARRQLDIVRAEIGPVLGRIQAAQDRIAVLLGHYPEDLRAELSKPALIPNLPDEIDPGVPVTLLRRRPDVREAEWELASATANVGVATAALFPSLTVVAGLGQEGTSLNSQYLPNNSYRIWSLGYGAILPLLDFGTLDALADVADLQAHVQYVHYKQTVLNAVADVDTSMAAFRAQQQRLRELADAVVASERAMLLASERYDRGLTDFLNVADAQRQEYDLEGQYAVDQTLLAERYVAVYQALGGGWENYGGPPKIRMPQPAIVAMFRRLANPGTGR